MCNSIPLLDRVANQKKEYLIDVAQKYGLYKYARFHTSVDAATWDEKTLKWETTVTVGGGKEAEFSSSYTISSDFLVAATGQLNKPKGIEVPGYEEYRGKIMHSARWDWSYDLKGKKIAIIGTGRSTHSASFQQLADLCRCYDGTNCTRSGQACLAIDNLPKNTCVGHTSP